MGQTRLPHPVEFREQMVQLTRAGRTSADLASEFDVSAQTIVWVRAAGGSCVIQPSLDRCAQRGRT